MNLSRRHLLFCAPALILTPGLLMPVKPLVVRRNIFVRADWGPVSLNCRCELVIDPVLLGNLELVYERMKL